MSDYERYGDYNEIDEDPAKKVKLLLNILKIATLLVCLGVVGLIAFRMIIFNTYPDSVTKLYFDESLTTYYENTNGEIGAKTQNLRFPYDDENLGNFFCDFLVVVDGIDQIQVTLRYNKSTIERINKAITAENIEREKVGLAPFSTLSTEAQDLFTFRLTDGKGNYYDGQSVKYDTRFMYRYHRLVFNEVDLLGADGSYPEGLMVEIALNVEELKDQHFITLKSKVDASSPKDPNADIFANGVFNVLIYENNEKHSAFSDYELSDGEAPEA